MGAASYLDAKEDKSLYYSKAKYFNPMLHKHLDWLYEKLSNTLADALNSPVQYSNKFALPGFHVFLAHKAFEQSMARVHRDLQYKLLEWEHVDEVNFHQPISFTLSITLPKYGGGLYTWDLHHDEINHLPYFSFQKLLFQDSNYYL